MSESPLGSPLSSHASSEFAEDIKTEDREHSVDSLADRADGHLMPPSKRRKIGTQGAFRSSTPSLIEAEDDEGDISSDSSGSVPASELGSLDDDHHEQVSACRWEGCPAGELGNMDELVKHIHDDHIGQRQKKYVCQWVGCQRQGSEHASGYALKAHTRSHTKEKPFICELPECDRSFTRSDALAKHNRTVHETDILKPSDPIPKGHSSNQQRPQRLKLVCNSKPPGSENNDTPSSAHPNDVEDVLAPEHEDDDATLPRTGSPSPMPEDLHFTEAELATEPYQLFRLLRRQVHWAEEQGKELGAECAALEKKRLDAFQRKELILANTIEAELCLAMARREDPNMVDHWTRSLPVPMLPIPGPEPWYRNKALKAQEDEKMEDVDKWIEDSRGQANETGLTARVESGGLS
ncbi:MAG: hypothetical protein LQ339_002947 [Xanthoria mediterranea]|nr:MAG: hypothetical protein LQ339_002947 [Xanthoria mediterranea]